MRQDDKPPSWTRPSWIDAWRSDIDSVQVNQTLPSAAIAMSPILEYSSARTSAPGDLVLGFCQSRSVPPGAGKIHDCVSGESGHGAPDQMDAILAIQSDSGADEETALFQGRFQSICRSEVAQ